MSHGDSEGVGTLSDLLRHYMWRERTPPITTNRLARELGVNRGTVMKWLQGATPAPALVERIAVRLGRPLAEVQALLPSKGKPVTEADVLAYVRSRSPDERQRILHQLAHLDDELHRPEASAPPRPQQHGEDRQEGSEDRNPRAAAARRRSAPAPADSPRHPPSSRATARRLR